MAIITEISRAEKLSMDSTEVTRVLRVDDWTARLVVANQLLGGVRLIGRRLVRVPPLRDPALRWAFCQSVDIAPVEEDHLVAGAGDNVLLKTGAYSGGAVLTCAYKNFDYTAQQGSAPETTEKNEVELATQTWEFSGQALTLPNRYLIWKDAATGGGSAGDDTLQMSEVAGTKQIPKFDVLLTRHFVLRKPTTAILTMLGTINKTAFKIGRDNYPAETLRFDSISMTQKLTDRGLKFFDTTMRFGVMGIWDKFKDDAGVETTGYVTWQRVFDPRKALWRKPVWFADNNRGIYQYDEDSRTQTILGQVKKGFILLFNPRAD